MSADVRKVVVLGVITFVALWMLTEALPEGLREPIRDRLMWAAALAIAAALFAAGALSLPWWVGIGGGAAVLAAAGALPTVRALVDGARDGDAGQYIQCGDWGTCGAVVDGSVCLGFECIRNGAEG